MKGFKNTTRTQYSMGGDVSGYAMGGYAKGGTAKGATKGAAKVAKVMGEFKRGELHSGSKEGPKVTKPAQAKAIAMSEARKAGMKAPMKKNEGGKVGKMPPLGESVKSGNRMSKMTAAERLAMEARFGEKKRPSPADSAKSGNRIAKEEAAEARHLGVFKKGGKVRKYAERGPVEPVMNLRRMEGSMPVFDGSNPEAERAMRKRVGQTNESLYGFNASSAYQNLGSQLKDMIDSGQLTIEQANALKAPAFEATRLRDVGQQRQAMDAALGAAYAKMPMPLGVGSAPGVGAPPLGVDVQTPLPPPPLPPPPPKVYDTFRPQVMPPVDPGFAIEPRDPNMPSVMPPTMVKQPRAGMVGGLLGALNNPRLKQDLQQAMMQQMPMGGGIGAELGRIGQRPGFVNSRSFVNPGPAGPPPAGMAPVDPNKAMMMKHGGRAAMSKGKR